jgi:hypothetical protein
LTHGADEAVLDVRQPNVISPSTPANPDIVAAAIVLIITHALGAQFGEGDFLRAVGFGHSRYSSADWASRQIVVRATILVTLHLREIKAAPLERRKNHL